MNIHEPTSSSLVIYKQTLRLYFSLISPTSPMAIAATKPYLFLSFTITFIYFSSVFSLIEATKHGFTVELIHRDSPKSPLSDNSTPISRFWQVNNALRRSIKRANHFFPDSKPLDDDPESEVLSSGGEYLMTYSLGTPETYALGIVDTGSDFIWLQCTPCDNCFNQEPPLFNQSNSWTYVPLGCKTSLCRTTVWLTVNDISCDKSYSCGYEIGYRDGSVSKGNIAHDTLTLGTSSGVGGGGNKVKFPKTLFGCGRNNSGFFSSKTTGIVGLGRGSLSLISQIGYYAKGKFSYCFVPLLSDKTGKLSFGENAVVSGADTVSTTFDWQKTDHKYHLTLEGISVGDKRLSFISANNSISKIKAVSEGNILIDSGTAFTVLPEDFYYKLEAPVSAELDFEFERVEAPAKELRLCYSVTSVEDIKGPSITFHFRGADVVLGPLNTFLMVSDEAACFAFLPGSSSRGAVYGTYAQINFLVGYDLHRNLVSFKPKDCSQL